MSRDLIASTAATLLPVLLLGLAALAAWLSSLIAGHIRNKRYAAAVTLLAYGAAGAVADLAQHTVDALKDPSKPGTWTATAGAAVRLRAIELVRQLYPLAVDFVTRTLRDPAKVDELLGTLVERAVVDLKAKAPTKVEAIALPGAAVVSARVGEAPLAGPTTADVVDELAHHRTTSPGQQPGRVTLGALVAIALVGLVALAVPGCPTVTEATLRAAHAPLPGDCQPLTQWCAETPDGYVPTTCSTETTPDGRHRAWPALPRDPADGRQRTCLHGCAVSDAGVAHCLGLVR